MLGKHIQKKFGVLLNSQQLNVVDHMTGPALTLACPGSGKTTALLFRTYNLIAHAGIKPQNILSLTFSRAAAKDMESRFVKTFGKHVNGKIRFSTIHAFSYNVLRNFYPRIYGHNFEVLNDKKLKLLKEIYKEITGEIINEDKLDELDSAIGYFKNLLISPEEVDQYEVEIPCFKDIFIAYERYKRKNHLVDYDDMLTIALWIFENFERILEKYRSMYHFIQVDEAQDTSKVQYEIIKLLAMPNNNLFMVADDDQSIYGFRGADPKALLGFQEIYENGQVYYMEENFRSSQDIIEASSKCIENNKNRYGKKMFTNNPKKRPVNVESVESYSEQVKYVVKQLKDTRDLDKTAILFRKNISAISLIDALDRNEIPFYIRDHKNSFFTHFAVTDIINFLRVAIDPTDREAFSKIYYKTNAYISKQMIENIMNPPKGNVFDQLRNSIDLQPYQSIRISELKGQFHTISTKTPAAAIAYILTSIGYRESLESYCKKFGYSLDSVYNILSTLSLIAENTNAIEEFLSRCSELEETIKSAAENRSVHAVTLSTLHSAKGLEFDKVFIIDLLYDEFPSKKSVELAKQGQFSDLEEERRLFYVGMTRAKTDLELLTVQGMSSLFLNEIRYIKEGAFDVGSKVIHPAFGKGHILKIDPSSYTVGFANGIKTLNKAIVLEKNLLRLDIS
ncbi:MAG: ATP-dependent helicase [Bacillota bacterium]